MIIVEKNRADVEILYDMAKFVKCNAIVEELQAQIDEINERRETNRLWNSPTLCRCGKMAEPHVFQERHSPYMSAQGWKCSSCGNSAHAGFCAISDYEVTVEQIRERLLLKGVE